MATHARILVVGRHEQIMARVQKLLESSGFTHVGALDDETAITLMRTSTPDAMLLGGGVETTSRARLTEAFRALYPSRPVIEHAGGPHGLIEHLKQRLGMPTTT